MNINIKIINVNKNEDNLPYIYVGRPSKYGNPYSSKEKSTSIYKTKNRLESIEKHKEYILNNLHIIDELILEMREKNIYTLGCYCFPKKCHADILKELIYEKLKYKSIF